MKKFVYSMFAIALACTLLFAQETAAGKSKTKSGAMKEAHKEVAADAVQWGDAPAVFPAGAQMAVLSGDPHKPGMFTVRLKVPDGYKVMPHWHPTAEYLTVISGTFAYGMGDKWDDGALHPVQPGGFIVMEPRSRHYATGKGETVVQVSGMGPFKLVYVNPQDDPTKKAGTDASKKSK
jgi:hypothetical protein